MSGKAKPPLSLLDRDFVHNFRLENVDQIDRGFRALMREAYRVGSQESSRPGQGLR